MLEVEQGIKLIGSLIFVGALLILFRWIMMKKKWMTPPGAEVFILKESLALDPRRKLIVVSYEGSSYLILLGPHTDLITPLASNQHRKDPSP